MSNNKIKRRGLSNKMALAVIAIGYPVGLISMSLAYIAHEKGTLVGAVSTIQKNEKQLSKAEAERLIRRWWKARSSIFAPPYNPYEFNDLIAKGPLWTDLTSNDGFRATLKKQNERYEYITTDLIKARSYDNEGTYPTFVAEIKSTTILRSKSKNDKKSSQKYYKYTFKYEEGQWKLWDYNTVK